jgi:hypothetical protein
MHCTITMQGRTRLVHWRREREPRFSGDYPQPVEFISIAAARHATGSVGTMIACSLSAGTTA